MANPICSDLDQLTDDFPEEFFKMKILPELIKSVEFGGGGPKAVGVIMKIAAKLSNEDFEGKITPFVVRSFANPDRALRVCLLDNLPLMFDRLPQKIVNDKIFPQMITGFTDLAPVVREQSLKSVLVIITKLSDRTINGDLLKQLAKTANDEQPGIRTNTTICLGKIAKNLGTSTRSKVLTAAFTRSLRDPFVHARNASLMSLGATVEHFSEEDIAGKLLPAVCPLLMDKEKLVRDSANRTIDTYLQKIRKAADNMPDTVLPPPQAAGAAGAAPRMATPQASESSGWTGWAISSFTNKVSAAAGDMQTTNSSASPQATSLSPDVRKLATASASLHRQAVASPPLDQSRGASPNPTAVAQAFMPPQEDIDDWGDMGDDDGFFDKPSADTSVVASPAPLDDGSEPDFGAWLTARAKKTVPSKPLPKGLSKSSTFTTKKPAAKPAAKPVVTKKIDLKPKEADDDDGWGDGW